MSSHLISKLTKKSQFGTPNTPGLNPYFLSFIIVLLLTIFIVLYCFITIYDKNFFKNLLSNFEQGQPQNPQQILSPGPPWPIPINLNQSNVYDYCKQKKKQQQQQDNIIKQELNPDGSH